MMGGNYLCFFILAVVCGAAVVLADDSNHVYQYGEDVHVKYNYVSKYTNPFQSYAFDYLPWCLKPAAQRSRLSVGGLSESLVGHTPGDSKIPVLYGKVIEDQMVCNYTLDEEGQERMRQSIRDGYLMHFEVDGLPMYSFLGEEVDGRYTVYSHLTFVFMYNHNNIINVLLIASGETPLDTEDIRVKYSVKWYPTEDYFEEREVYHTLDLRIHSIVSMVLVTTFILIILGVLLMSTFNIEIRTSTNQNTQNRSDSVIDIESTPLTQTEEPEPPKYDYFKIISKSKNLEILLALIGNGAKLTFLLLLVLVLNMLMPFNPSKSLIASLVIVLYPICNFSGSLIVTSAFIKIYEGDLSHSTTDNDEYHHINIQSQRILKRSILYYSFLIPVTITSIYILLLLVTPDSSQLNFISPSNFLTITLYFLLLETSSSIAGVHYGRKSRIFDRWNISLAHIEHDSDIIKQEDERLWYNRPITAILSASILPAAYFIHYQEWLYTCLLKYVFFEFTAFFTLQMVGGFVAIGITNIIVTFSSNKSSSDYPRWPWLSWFSSFSISLYLSLYSLYFMSQKTQISSPLDRTYFTLLSLLISALFGLISSFIGFVISTYYLSIVYKNKSIFISR